MIQKKKEILKNKNKKRRNTLEEILAQEQALRTRQAIQGSEHKYQLAKY